MDHPPGPPRLDQTERLRHRLYEPLNLLWMLNPVRGASHARSRHFIPAWRAFLDNLAWCCDFKHGGLSVSAVAAEVSPAGTRYWLASAHKSALPHLEWILPKLATAYNKSNAEVVDMHDEIERTTIEFSRDKVKKYGLQLSKSFKQAAPTLSVDDLADQSIAQLLEALKTLAELRNRPIELCQAASQFNQHAQLDDLVRVNIEPHEISPWATVRHCIGRLQAWHKKAALLVQFARHYPEVLEASTCEWIDLPAAQTFPRADSKTNLFSALGRMLPQDRQREVEELHSALLSLRGFNFDDVFAESYGNQKLSLPVHAEVFLMEHFYFNRMRFAEGDKYIGTSKPSCYCCSLYTRYHPGNFVVQPSHGNAWVTWSPPLLDHCDDPKIRKHNTAVLNSVVAHLRRDVLGEIETRLPRRQRPPDSTSGLATRSFAAETTLSMAD